jgi:GTP-binding protein YchF
MGKVDPERAMVSMESELALADISVLEHRAERLEASLKGAKAPERAQALKEQELLARVKAELEKGTALRQQGLTHEEAEALQHYQLLTAKPLLTVVNIAEEQASQTLILEETLAARFPREGKLLTALCGKLEMELSQLSAEEEREFRASLGLEESGLEKVLRLSFAALGLISFFTFVSSEVRAWTVPQSTPAIKAAGKIHSDMERGFIRAEVVHYNDLVRSGSLAQARKQGLLRLEGKTYPVVDGDVITFLFNV